MCIYQQEIGPGCAVQGFLPDGRAQDRIANNEVHFFKVRHRPV